MEENRLSEYYEGVRTMGKLRTIEHAHRWSDGVLKTLGICLDGGTKRELAKNLPEELAESLKGVFWLLHFRNPEMPADEFLLRVGRRSGNTDAEFAYHPTVAVFAGINRFIASDLSARISQNLSEEVQELWQAAVHVGAAQ